MDASVYQALAARTINKNLSRAEMKLHALHGMSAEVGELHGIFQKCYQGHRVQTEHLKKEAGDICWMLAEFCTVMGWDLSEIMELNIEKLKARFPEGFDPDKSMHRAEGDV